MERLSTRTNLLSTQTRDRLMFRGVIDGLGHAIGLRFRKSGEALKKFCSSQL